MRRFAWCLFLLPFLVLLTLGADKDLAGTYDGDWSGASGSGKLHLELQRAGDEWKCVASFTFGGQEFKTKTKSVKVDGAKVEIRYEFEIQGTMLESTLNGELSRATLEGKYRTVNVSDGSPADEGAWKASQARSS